MLYLDFDGVTHPVGTPVIDELGRFHPEWPGVLCWMSLLEHALRPYPDIGLVVSSSWRFLQSDEQLRTLLGPLGGRFAGVTTQDHLCASRLEEIIRHAASLQHDRFVVLDDDATVRTHMRETGDPRFIWCAPDTGISEPRVLIRMQRQLRKMMYGQQ